MRQSLIDESQNRYDQIKKQADNLYNEMSTSEFKEQSRQAKIETYSQLIGEMKALRGICEWAKDHSAPDLNRSTTANK